MVRLRHQISYTLEWIEINLKKKNGEDNLETFLRKFSNPRRFASRFIELQPVRSTGRTVNLKKCTFFPKKGQILAPRNCGIRILRIKTHFPQKMHFFFQINGLIANRLLFRITVFRKSHQIVATVFFFNKSRPIRTNMHQSIHHRTTTTFRHLTSNFR